MGFMSTKNIAARQSKSFYNFVEKKKNLYLSIIFIYNNINLTHCSPLIKTSNLKTVFFFSRPENWSY